MVWGLLVGQVCRLTQAVEALCDAGELAVHCSVSFYRPAAGITWCQRLLQARIVCCCARADSLEGAIWPLPASS
jgi:hypothetical protein